MWTGETRPKLYLQSSESSDGLDVDITLWRPVENIHSRFELLCDLSKRREEFAAADEFEIQRILATAFYNHWIRAMRKGLKSQRKPFEMIQLKIGSRQLLIVTVSLELTKLERTCYPDKIFEIYHCVMDEYSEIFRQIVINALDEGIAEELRVLDLPALAIAN